MATYYALQQVGVADGTQIPSLKADNRQVGAKAARTIATKDNTNALAANDLVYLGKIRQGEMLVNVSLLSDTSFGAVTISIGTLASPTKYVNADTMTTTNKLTALSLLASAVAAGPLAADEDIYAKVSGTVAAAVVAHFFLDTVGIR